MLAPNVIQLTQFIAHPPAKVWQALTDPAFHVKWWAAGDIAPIVGHRFTLDMGAWGQQPCEVLAVDPEQLFAYSFAAGTLDTTITWRLAAERDPTAGDQTAAEGTRLSLQHKGFDLDSSMGRAAFQGMSEGWPKVISQIEATIEGE